MERRVIGRKGPARRGQELHCEVTHEGSFLGQEDLFEMQDCAPCRRGEGDLRKPEAQAAARMSSKFENRNSKIETRCGQRHLRQSRGAPRNVTPARGGVHGVMGAYPSAGSGPALGGNELSADF